MAEYNETNARIQSIRIKNLEEQFHLMQRELQRLRVGLLHQSDVEKLSNLMKGLRELNLILIDLRNYYSYKDSEILYQDSTLVKRNNNYYTEEKDPSKLQNTKISNENVQDEKFNRNDKKTFNRSADPASKNFANVNQKYYARENAGLDLKESTAEIEINNQLLKKTNVVADTKEELKDPFKSCQQLLNETKSPSSILGNYLMALQDFRVDPELRRQRWEKKQRDKLQKLQERKHTILSMQDKATLMEERNINGTRMSIVEPKRIEYHNDEVINDEQVDPTNSQYHKNDSLLTLNLPVVQHNLTKVIDEITNETDRRDLVLTIVLEQDLYHISFSQISNGHIVACFLASEGAIEEAKKENVFQDFLTFLVVDAENAKSQKDRILGHLFEFFRMGVH